ncbi:unnamed protein product [Penicillium palitans]
MDLDGVAFLDACATDFTFVPEEAETWDPQQPQIPGSRLLHYPFLSGLLGLCPHEFDLPCDILSCALKSPSKGNDGPNKQPSIPQGLLHQTLKAFPQGHFLSLEAVDEDKYPSNDSTGAVDSQLEPDTQTCAKHLARCLPGAKSALFLPI